MIRSKPRIPGLGPRVSPTSREQYHDDATDAYDAVVYRGKAMTDEAKALLATLTVQERRAVETRDRAHRLAGTLRGAMTAIRMGDDPDVIALRLRKRGVEIEA